MTSYEEGWQVALLPPEEQPKCPYSPGTKQFKDWEDGYGDATEFMINWNGGMDELDCWVFTEEDG